MALADQFSAVESGGNRYAKNPKSSAYGPHQFIAPTWMAMIRKYRPDLLNGRSEGEVLALRSEPALSAEMSNHYEAENADYLRARGFEPTPSNLYLAHFAGPEGAAKVLSNPDAPVSNILSADAIEANPFLRGWKGQDVANWAAGKMGWKAMATPSQVSAAPAPVAASAPSTPTALAKPKDDAVIPFLMEMFAAMGGPAGATAAGAAGTAAGATGLGTTAAAPSANLFGEGNLLSSLFGGGGGQSGQPDPVMPRLGAAPQPGLLPMRPVDMSGLQNMIAKRPRLGA